MRKNICFIMVYLFLFILVAFSTDTIFVADKGGSLLIFDTTNLERPTFLSSVDYDEENFLDSTKIIGMRDDYLFLHGYRTLSVVNIADIKKPKRVLTYKNYWPKIEATAIYDDYLLIAGHNTFLMLDASIPENLHAVTLFKINGEVFDIATNDYCAFLAMGNKGLQVLDISNPKDIKVITIFNEFPVYAIYTKMNFLYLLTDNELMIFDISDIYTPKEVFRKSGITGQILTEDSGNLFIKRNKDLLILTITGHELYKILEFNGFFFSSFESMKVKNSIIYVANGDLGLFIYQLDNNDKLILLSRYHPEENEKMPLNIIDKVFLFNGKATNVVLGYETNNKHIGDEVELIDISDPHNPICLGNIPYAYDYIIIGDYLYCANSYFEKTGIYFGFTIIDYKSLALTKLKSVPAPRELLHPVLFNSNSKFLFVLYDDAGSSIIEVLDVKDPFNPEVVSRFEINDDCMDFCVDENNLYFIGRLNSDLRIFSIEDINKPKEIWKKGFLYPFRIVCSDGFLYIYCDDGTWKINIEDKANPKIIVKRSSMIIMDVYVP